jgi:hypothetical protein
LTLLLQFTQLQTNYSVRSYEFDLMILNYLHLFLYKLAKAMMLSWVK